MHSTANLEHIEPHGINAQSRNQEPSSSPVNPE